MTPSNHAPNGADRSAARQLLEFRLRGQRYAIDILSVKEVIAYQEPTPVFHTPSHVRGLINLRGVVIALLDTAFFFDLPEADLTPLTRIMVIRSRAAGVEQEAGFIVDGVIGSRWVDASGFFSPPPTIDDAIREYITGVVEEAQGPLILLSADKIFISEKVANL